MKRCLVILVTAVIVVALPGGCSGGDGILRLTFDGDSCASEGPSKIGPGPVVFEFVNDSDDVAAANMVRLDHGHTIQDVIEYNGPEPFSGHAPSWSRDVLGVWKETGSGETHRWEGNLEPGTYFTVCVGLGAWRGWNGAGLEVEG